MPKGKLRLQLTPTSSVLAARSSRAEAPLAGLVATIADQLRQLAGLANSSAKALHRKVAALPGKSVRSVVGVFLQIGALKLSDEVLVKHKAATLHVRSSALLFLSHRQSSRPNGHGALEPTQSVNGLISKSHLAGYDHHENSRWNIKPNDGVIMSAIFELLYREYCRARLAEMRKQLLIEPERAEALDADHLPATRTSDGGMDTHRKPAHHVPH